MAPGSLTIRNKSDSEEREASGVVFRLPARFGKYLLTKRLGVGGMAEVFLAQQDGPAGFSKPCVVKRILPHLALDARFVRMFQAEARLAALLSHQNIVQIFELGEVDGIHFIAMEHVDGTPLHALARSAWRRGRSLPLEVICCAIADAALGLQAAHDQIGPDGKPLQLVHRDISPDNLMINRDGITKVLDFGIAKSTAHDGRTATGELKGKIPFMSPEQVRGDPIDGRADLYALGVTFYWMLTGRRPLTAATELGMLQTILSTPAMPPRMLNDTIPPVVDDLVIRLLDKDPARRPQNASEVHDTLAAATAARRSVVAPFVREILDNPDPVGVDTDLSLTPGFLPSTPQVEEIQAAWRKLVLQNAPPEPVAAAPSPTPTPDVDIDIDIKPPAPAWRSLALGLVTSVLVAGVGIGAIAVSRTPTAPATAPPATTTPATTTPATTPATTTTPALPTTPDPQPEPKPQPTLEPVIPADPPFNEHATPLRDVVIACPAHIVWQTDKGRVLRTGPGSFKLPANVKRIVAVDPRRGATTSVAVADRIDYANLPRGKVQARANPFADVFLGREELGVTPFPATDVVAGRYTLRFVHEKREETRTVVVGAGETVRVVVDFTAP